MEGNGYISDKTTGVNIHTSLAVTADDLVLGVLDQRGYKRPERREEMLTKERQKNRPIEEKESNRRLESMETVGESIGGGQK
jgi:hypothetical protein